jgi:5-(carboxyamino)imidazole ribonucleotide synthase
LPLGDARMHSYAVMVNILGDAWKNGVAPAWHKALAHPELKMHLYGKHEARKGRKMGHFTVIGKVEETVVAQAMQARRELGIGENELF